MWTAETVVQPEALRVSTTTETPEQSRWAPGEVGARACDGSEPGRRAPAAPGAPLIPPGRLAVPSLFGQDSYHGSEDSRPRVPTIGGVSVLSVGTTSQIHAQRNKFLEELNAVIEEDIASRKTYFQEIQDLLRAIANSSAE